MKLRRHHRPVAGPRPATAPETIGFIAAVLRQMDHAATLVAAFFHRIGMMGPHQEAMPHLPGQFLLELAALLHVREWHAGGVIDWFDPEGMSIDEMIGQVIERLKNDPVAVAAGRSGTEAMTDMLRIWTETCAPDARAQLDADMAIRWDNSNDLDLLVDQFATFLCRHRNAGQTTEAL